MDSASRTAIACSNCAKAKAKCDKKVPCTRCVSKHTPCLSRSARRSFNVASRKEDRQYDSFGKAPGGFCTNRVTKIPVEAESSISRQNRGTNPQLPRAACPTTSSPFVDSFLSENRPTILKERIFDVDQSTQTNRQTYNQEAEQQNIYNGLTQATPGFSTFLTPTMQSISEMDDFMQENGSSYVDQGDNQFLTMGDIHNPSEFDISILPDFMSPGGAIHNIVGYSTLEPVPGEGKGFSESVHVSASTSSAYHSGNGSPSSMSSQQSPRLSHEAHPKSMYHRALQEHEAVIAAQEGWPCFRCNPPLESSSCPKTARIYLEGLEQTLKNQDTWNSWGTQRDEVDHVVNHEISTEPFAGCTRDKLLAITQSFLHKALEIHRTGPGGSPEEHGNSDFSCAEFIILPPPNVLEYFLRAYVCRFEPYYAFVPGGILKPNELMQLSNGKASSLLLLLMVAQGAMATPTVESRYLTSGLTEACRLSLFDIIEKDIVLSLDPVVLRCALMFTILAAWSGDKWHMDIAMGQRGMYTAMLSHAGMLEFRESRLSILARQTNPEAKWEVWKEHESKSRLVYSWVTVDQELSLFHDAAPMLSITSLNATMPDADVLWQARSASEWLESHEQFCGTFHEQPPSLRDLFRHFVEGELADQRRKLSPTQLRLLLHPLQALVCHLRQFLSCFSDGGGHCKASRAITKSATRARLEEVQCLLQQWYTLFNQCTQHSTNLCSPACANLIIYHLISLNTITCFPEIERLARCEVARGPVRQSSWLPIRCTEEVEEIFFHCGQILRLVRSIPRHVRPPWWAAAVYRVALISWANSMANAGTRFQMSQSNERDIDAQFAIDALVPEHPLIERYLKYREGLPMFSKPDGAMVSLDVPGNVLTHCIEIVDDDSTMRFTAGIRNKLGRLAERWKT